MDEEEEGASLRGRVRGVGGGGRGPEEGKEVREELCVLFVWCCVCVVLDVKGLGLA